MTANSLDVYLEIGKKKIFAGAIEWPGWSRSGKDEAAALQALIDYGPRYLRVLQRSGLNFQAPGDPSALSVIERLEGNATTDFGAPGMAPAADARPLDQAELQRFQAVLEACLDAFAEAVQAAEGKELHKGPRGGGRELEKIIRHVLEANDGYLRQLGWKPEKGGTGDFLRELDQARKDNSAALAAAARGKLPAKGPRGGDRWTPRYFARRAAWHILDHVWEIEDRIL